MKMVIALYLFAFAKTGFNQELCSNIKSHICGAWKYSHTEVDRHPGKRNHKLDKTCPVNIMNFILFNDSLPLPHLPSTIMQNYHTSPLAGLALITYNDSIDVIDQYVPNARYAFDSCKVILDLYGNTYKYFDMGISLISKDTLTVSGCSGYEVNGGVYETRHVYLRTIIP